MLNGERRVHSVIELSSSSSEDEPATSHGPSSAEQGKNNNNNNNKSNSKKGSQLHDQSSTRSLHIKAKEQPSAGSSSSNLKNKTTSLQSNSRSFADRSRASSSSSKKKQPQAAVSDSEPDSESGPASSDDNAAPPLKSGAKSGPRLKRGRPIRRPPPLPKTMQSCSSVLGLVLPSESSRHSTSKVKSTTALPSALSGGLNRTGSVLLKSSSTAHAAASQRSTSPEKSQDSRGVKRKRRSPSHEVKPGRADESAFGSDSSDSSSESEGEIRWASLWEEPTLRWHRAPQEADDGHFASPTAFTDKFTWQRSRRDASQRRSQGSRGTNTFTKMGQSSGFLMSSSKPSLARMIVHPCLGHSSQVVLDNNPSGNSSTSKSEASLELPLRPPEPSPPPHRRLTFQELANDVGFDSSFLTSSSSSSPASSSSSSSDEEDHGTASHDKGKDATASADQASSADDEGNGGATKPSRRTKKRKKQFHRARKSALMPIPALVPGGPQDLGTSEEALASASTVIAHDAGIDRAQQLPAAVSGRENADLNTSAETGERVNVVNGGARGTGAPERRANRSVFEKPQWVWASLLEQIRSGDVPRSALPSKLLAEVPRSVNS